MGTFFGLILIMSVIVWGTAFTALYFWRQTRTLDRGVESDVTARLLEDVDDLSTRLTRVEEELEFYKKLNAPEPTNPEKTLPGPEDPER